MRDRYGGPPAHSAAAHALVSSINLLSVIYARIYFPVYSNGLKEIACCSADAGAEPARGLGALPCQELGARATLLDYFIRPE